MGDIFLRKLEEQDWALLRVIRLRALDADPGVFSSNFKDESQNEEKDWRGQLAQKNTAIFGIFQNDQIIGMTSVSIHRDDPWQKIALLWGSWLERSCRGKGLSVLMYEKRIEWAYEHPTCEKITVSHRASNIASMRANQKHGFVKAYTISKQWPDGIIEDDIFYELILDKNLRTH